MPRSPCAEGGGRQATLARHGLPVRLLHAVNALAVLVLLATGAALDGRLGAGALLGGHAALHAAHQKLGLLFVIAWLLLAAWRPGAFARLLGQVLHYRRGDASWPLAFLRFCFRPDCHAAPFHDGRFDPAQRLVFLALIATALLASASGIYLYLAPPLGPAALAWAIRLHMAAVWLLMGGLGLHIVAGAGVLPTHRGLARAMFGNGRVPAALAQVLWPAWAGRAAAKEAAAGPAGAPAPTPDDAQAAGPGSSRR